MTHYTAGNLDKAIELFDKILIKSRYESYGDDANYFLALSYWRKKDYQNTAILFSSLVQEYPESHFVPEALFHILKSETMRGNKDMAMAAASKLMEQFPNNLWTRYATDYLKENQ